MNLSSSLSAKICFNLNREFYAEEKLDEAGNLIYQPPPLHEVRLDEAGRQQGNKDCIW